MVEEVITNRDLTEDAAAARYLFSQAYNKVLANFGMSEEDYRMVLDDWDHDFNNVRDLVERTLPKYVKKVMYKDMIENHPVIHEAITYFVDPHSKISIGRGKPLEFPDNPLCDSYSQPTREGMHRDLYISDRLKHPWWPVCHLIVHELDGLDMVCAFDEMNRKSFLALQTSVFVMIGHLLHGNGLEAPGELRHHVIQDRIKKMVESQSEVMYGA